MGRLGRRGSQEGESSDMSEPEDVQGGSEGGVERTKGVLPAGVLLAAVLGHSPSVEKL